VRCEEDFCRVEVELGLPELPSCLDFVDRFSEEAEIVTVVVVVVVRFSSFGFADLLEDFDLFGEGALSAPGLPVVTAPSTSPATLLSLDGVLGDGVLDRLRLPLRLLLRLLRLLRLELCDFFRDFFPSGFLELCKVMYLASDSL